MAHFVLGVGSDSVRRSVAVWRTARDVWLLDGVIVPVGYIWRAIDYLESI